MIDYEKVCKSLAYLIETMNGFQDEVLKYKYSKALVHYKNYIETYKSNGARLGLHFQYLKVQQNTGGKHNAYLYFPHLNEEVGIVDELVNIETVSQFQHDLLVKAGMPITTEPIEQGDIVTFRVAPEIGQEYFTLLAFAIEEYKTIIAQSE